MSNITLITRCHNINDLYYNIGATNTRSEKELYIKEMLCEYPELEDDINFCFEVLAGKHKLGYTLKPCCCDNWKDEEYNNLTIRQFYQLLKTDDFSDDAISEKSAMCCEPIADFVEALVNREFKLGYSNKNKMLTNLSPMLAKKYPDDFKGQSYYVQEKLDGNRCIAYYDDTDSKWHFQSRSGKPMNLDFDMSWASEVHIFDGEVMTLGKAGSRDFNKTSGAINSKYGNKSELHYYIYDIIREEETYESRKIILDIYASTNIGKDCTILPVLDKLYLHPNTDYNWQLDEWLDKITNQGGEGLILRDPTGKYEHVRSTNLLKYKKTKTMDLRIIGYNEGNGKYSGLIGSFICESDDHSIVVNVAGMSDNIRISDPSAWIGKIIEVAYFDISQSKNGGPKSLRFPRLKKVRDDKTETSVY